MPLERNITSITKLDDQPTQLWKLWKWAIDLRTVF